MDPNKRSLLKPLDTIGEYKVYKKDEGRGTFGEIHLVQKHGKGQEVYALKRINLLNCGEKDKQHCHDEVMQLKQSEHENVVKYIDSFQEGNYLCIVMEYCKGGNLRRYINSRINKLEEDEFLGLFKQICKGLKSLHDRGIAHRDIKPTNILLTERNQIKIADFGLAKSLENHALTKNVGSPFFMSPEMINGQDYTIKTDIWSLACCMFEMGTKTTLFTARDIESLKEKLKSPEKIKELAKGLPFCMPLQQQFCAMLHEDSDKRPSVDELLQFLVSHSHETKQRPRRKRQDLSKTCPARFGEGREDDWLNPVNLDDLEDLDESGIDTDASESHNRSTVMITAEIYVTKEQREWYVMMRQAEGYLSKKTRGNMMQKLREACFETRNQPDDVSFMERAKRILGEPIYTKCEAHLRSFRSYKIELLKYEYRMA